MPALDNGGRWHHIASDAEVRAALRDKESVVIEAPVIQCSFIVSRKHLTTLRAGAGGGDVFAVEGGWVYAHDLAQRLDEREVRQVAEIPVRL